VNPPKYYIDLLDTSIKGAFVIRTLTFGVVLDGILEILLHPLFSNHLSNASLGINVKRISVEVGNVLLAHHPFSALQILHLSE
jgi:hypothetical protein